VKGAAVLYAWKFIIRDNKEVPDPAEVGLSYVGPFVAVATAETEEKARELLADFALANGVDSRWLRAATVHRLPLDRPAMIAWASA